MFCTRVQKISEGSWVRLLYEFVSITEESCLACIQAKLRGEFDFAYSPLFSGGQRLFREKISADAIKYLPVRVLLFKYVPEDLFGSFSDEVAAQDIACGIDNAGIMGWDRLLWEWQICSKRQSSSGEIPITYKYESDGDDSHIVYDVADTLEATVLIPALETIIELCRAATSDDYYKFAGRIDSIACCALAEYGQRCSL
jgi:hypothetical protein